MSDIPVRIGRTIDDSTVYEIRGEDVQHVIVDHYDDGQVVLLVADKDGRSHIWTLNEKES